MDGTFDTTLHHFNKVFTIHSLAEKRLVPLVNILMSDRTDTLHSTIFNDIKIEWFATVPDNCIERL